VNGFFVGYNGTAFGVLHRVNSVDTWTAQTAWNTDKADGTQSLALRDWTKLQIWEIVIGYLGTAPVQFKLFNGGLNGSEFITCHEMLFANARTTPHLTNCTLPWYAQCDNKATTTNLVARSASIMVAISGDDKIGGFINNVFNTKASISTTETNIITLRNNTTHQGITNTTTVYPTQLSIALVDAKRTNTIKVILNTTLGGSPSYTNVSSDSVCSYDTAGTTITGGTVLCVYVLSIDDAVNINLKDLGITLSPGDTLTVSSVAIAADTATVTVSLGFIEDF
jgi:hypothetical protein